MLKSTKNNKKPKNTAINRGQENIDTVNQPDLIEEAKAKIRTFNTNKDFQDISLIDIHQIQSIKESIDKIKESSTVYKNTEIITLMWSLSKSRYREEGLFLKYKNNIVDGMVSIGEPLFVVLLQTMAASTLFDSDILNACLRRLPKLTLLSDKAKIITAYYMSMILINSVKGNGYEALEEQMRAAIISLVDSIKKPELEYSEIRSIFDIYSAGIITLPKKKLKHYKRILRENDATTTSIAQQEIFNFIRSNYQVSEPEIEFYDELMCTHRDIKFSIYINGTKFDFIVEVDGLTHYHTNEPEIQTGYTLFRYKILLSQIGCNCYVITIRATTRNMNIQSILTQLNETITSIREEMEANSANLKKEEPIEPVHSPDPSEQGTEKNTAIPTKNNDSKKKQNNKAKNKAKKPNLDSLLESCILENTKISKTPHVFNESDYNDMLNKYKAKTLSKLLEQTYNNVDLGDFKLITAYKKGSVAVQNHAKILLNKEINRIESNLENANPETLEKINWLIEYADINSQAKCLVFSIAKGFDDLFATILDIHLPNKENTNVFIDLLFFANLCNNKLNIAKLLFEKYPINIDSHYKFIYAFSVTSMFSDSRLHLDMDIATSFVSEYFKNKNDRALYTLLKNYHINRTDLNEPEKEVNEPEKEVNILASYLASRAFINTSDASINASNASINNAVIHWLLDEVKATYNMAKNLSVDANVILESFHFPDLEKPTISRDIILKLYMLCKKNDSITMKLKERIFDFIPKEMEASDGAIGLSPLHILAHSSDEHLNIILYLNTVGFDINQELKKADDQNSTHLIVKVKEKKEDKEYRIPYGATPASLILQNAPEVVFTILLQSNIIDISSFNSHLGCSILDYCKEEKRILYNMIMKFSKDIELQNDVNSNLIHTTLSTDLNRNSIMALPNPREVSTGSHGALITPSSITPDIPSSNLSQTTLSTDLIGNITNINSMVPYSSTINSQNPTNNKSTDSQGELATPTITTGLLNPILRAFIDPNVGSTIVRIFNLMYKKLIGPHGVIITPSSITPDIPSSNLSQTTLSTDPSGNTTHIDYNHTDYTPAQSPDDRKIDGSSLKR